MAAKRNFLEAMAAALDAALAGEGFNGGDFDGMNSADFEGARQWVSDELASATPNDAKLLSREDAEILRNMMEEFWRKRELSEDEERVFLTICTVFNFGRPVPPHGSGPASADPRNGDA